MANANYRPDQAVAFWDIMTQKSGQKPLEFMSTHPSDTKRISAMEAYIKKQGYQS